MKEKGKGREWGMGIRGERTKEGVNEGKTDEMGTVITEAIWGFSVSSQFEANLIVLNFSLLFLFICALPFKSHTQSTRILLRVNTRAYTHAKHNDTRTRCVCL